MQTVGRSRGNFGGMEGLEPGIGVINEWNVVPLKVI